MIAGVQVEIVQLLISPVHRYGGRPDADVERPPGELVDAVQLRAGLGVVGDRYYAKPAHRDAAVTLLDEAQLPAGVGLLALRRTVLLRGLAVDGLIGSTVSLDTGTGPVVLRVRSAARPCSWLDVVVGPGTRRVLVGKAGVRCEVRSDGRLRLGAARVELSAPESRR